LFYPYILIVPEKSGKMRDALSFLPCLKDRGFQERGRDEIKHIEQIERYFELHVLTWDIPIGRPVKSAYLTPHYTRDTVQGVVTCTGMGISYTADIPVQAQKQKKLAIPNISTN
jgi:hypothetical protein